ncbi:nucleoside-diphosphate-sugar epimerase [Histoplasma capsulatum G186AR]|nr:nucleoside-diphosphate-sugar epimerase [Histoplasma capsulatum]QSS73204.1 nucleoside-diphosphate-sugar epimerase [Histoplasma capsulatum G186AR]
MYGSSQRRQIHKMPTSILITGAGGFIGQELTTALLNATPADTTLTITDITSPPIPTRASKHASRVASIQTDLTSRTAVDSLIDSGASPPRRYDVVYILHGIMSSGSESNFDLGMNVNLFATQYILDRLRRTMPGVKVVYTSSLAVYGPTAPGFVITERNMPQMPTSSYGMEKMVIELLLNDYSRRGFLDGRVMRLPTVTVRAGAPTQAASSFASGILREPLNGVKSVLPVKKETELWICSPYTIVKNLIHAKDVPSEAFGDSRSVNLPGIKVSVQKMLDVLEVVGGTEKRALVEEKPDEDVNRIVQGWSPNFDTAWAKSLGFYEDMSLLDSVQRFVSEYLK